MSFDARQTLTISNDGDRAIFPTGDPDGSHLEVCVPRIYNILSFYVNELSHEPFEFPLSFFTIAGLCATACTCDAGRWSLHSIKERTPEFELLK